MFKYTKAAVKLMLNDFKKIGNCLKLVFIVMSLLYYIFSILFETGNIVINIILLSIIILYSVFEIIFTKIENKELKFATKRIFGLLKLFVKAVSLGIVIYTVYITSEITNPISIVILTLTIVLWVLQFLLEIVLIVINKYFDYIMVGINKDKENAKNVGNAVLGVVSGGTSLIAKKIINKKEKNKKYRNLSIEEKLEKHIN